MKTKKILSVLLTGAMVFGLAACGGGEAGNSAPQKSDSGVETKNDAPQEAESKEGEGQTITILWPESDSTQVEVMNDYLKPALEEKFPDITFEYTAMTGTAADSPIKTLSASGDLPEIFFTHGSDIDAVLGAGDALDLAPYVEKNEWVKENYSTPDLLYNGDAIYFLTPGQNAYYSPVFYYNKGIFDANGIKEPANMEELVAACQTLVDAGITPITTAGWVSSYSLIDGFIASAAPDAFIELNQRKCDWTDGRIADALSYFDQMKTMGAFASDIATKDDATAYSEFQSGNTAMMLTYSWFNGDMVEENLGFAAGSFSFPNDSDDYIQLIFEPRKGNGGGYTANAKKGDPELLAEIMKVIVQAESERHNANGVNTNFKVTNPAEASNEFEERRMADYDRASRLISVLEQGQMDGPTVAEFTTCYNMLISDDKGYLSKEFIEEFEPIWEANTYGATE